MSRRPNLRDPRVWPEDRHHGPHRLRVNDREIIDEALDQLADAATLLRFSSTNRDGVHIEGRCRGDAEPTVESCYRLGWQSLTVTDPAGHEVGLSESTRSPGNDTPPFLV